MTILYTVHILYNNDTPLHENNEIIKIRLYFNCRVAYIVHNNILYNADNTVMRAYKI